MKMASFAVLTTSTTMAIPCTGMSTIVVIRVATTTIIPLFEVTSDAKGLMNMLLQKLEPLSGVMSLLLDFDCI